VRMSSTVFAELALTLLQSSNTLSHDPVFLGMFFVLGYRKLFSTSSNTTFGSILLLGALSVAAAWFVRACARSQSITIPTTAPTAAPTAAAPQNVPFEDDTEASGDDGGGSSSSSNLEVALSRLFTLF